MENLPIKTFDVLSFTGLIALLPFILEGLKSIMKVLITGREPLVCMILAYAIGIPVKYFTPTAYNGQTGPMGWMLTVIGLFLCAVAAQNVHDKVLAGMFGWNADPLSKPPTSGGAGQSGNQGGSP